MEFLSWNPRVVIQRYREWREERQEEYIVRINNPRTRIKGKIKWAKVLPSFKYVAFQGIPFALPPVGDRRFQPPEEMPQPPPGQQTPPLKAYKKPNPCAQESVFGVIIGKEDCLYLNVYTPGKPGNIQRLLPVLVYIHGGGFVMGTSTVTNPENILRENLIVVTINYRLDLFGFLNMRSENCRGNAGMKDQVMALTWVQNNIRAFKGDPQNVTICGQSAGGSSVNFHMISPMSKGLFHKAIVMAGGVYCPWGYGGHAKNVKELFKKATNRENEMRNVVVEALKTKKTKELLKLSRKVMEKATKLEPKRLTVHYCPTVEYDPVGAFLPDTVENLMRVAEPVPTIAGITKQEGYMHFRTDPIDSIDMVRNPKELKELLRQNLHFKDAGAVDRHFPAIKALYFPNEKTTNEEEKKHQLATLMTDLYFRNFYDNFKIPKLLDEEGPSFYVYEFDYFAGKPLSSMPKIGGRTPVVRPTAAEHSDDFVFLFFPEYLLKLYSRLPEQTYLKRRELHRVKSNMCYLWSSFCRNGVPKSHLVGDAGVNWLKHTEQAPHYLRIAKNLSLKPGRLNEERWTALNEIIQSESMVPSLAVSPQTSVKELKLLEMSPLEPGPSSPVTTADLITLESDTSSWGTAVEEMAPRETDL